MIGTGAVAALTILNLWDAYQGAKTAAAKGDTVGEILSLSTAVPGVNVVTAPAKLHYDAVMTWGEHQKWMVNCTEFAFADVYGGVYKGEVIEDDDERRFECWDYYPNSDKPDLSGAKRWEWE